MELEFNRILLSTKSAQAFYEKLGYNEVGLWHKVQFKMLSRSKSDAGAPHGFSLSLRQVRFPWPRRSALFFARAP